MSVYRYPPHMAPTQLLMLAAEQAGYDFSRMPDLRSLLDRIVTGTIEIDTSPAACRRVVRAMQEVDDRKAGIARLRLDDLVKDRP